MEGTCDGAVHEKVQLMEGLKGLIVEKFVEDCLLQQGSHNGTGEDCEDSSS